jgi:FkbM family methyltransferase
MNRSRRKIEEFLWITGLHTPARSFYGAMIGREASKHRHQMSEFYAKLLPSGSLVFDIGANAGMFSAIFSSLNTKVVALEPNTDCVRHIQLSYASESIEVIQAAAGAHNGLAIIHLSDQRDDISSVSTDWMDAIQRQHNSYKGLWSRQATVPMLTLDTLWKHYGAPYFIKIDVEGYEESVLDGLSVQPPLVSFEFNSAYLPAAMRCLDKKVFGSSSVFNFAMGDPAHFELDTWVNKERLTSILSKLANADQYGDLFVKRQES